MASAFRRTGRREWAHNDTPSRGVLATAFASHHAKPRVRLLVESPLIPRVARARDGRPKCRMGAARQSTNKLGGRRSIGARLQ